LIGMRKVLSSAALVSALVLICAGCVTNGANQYPAAPPASAVATIDVAKHDLKLTVSLDAQVVATPTFAVLAPAAGAVSYGVKPGDAVKAGQRIGAIGTSPVVAPVSGVVAGLLADAGQQAPAGLPVVAIRFTGFALQGTPAAWGETLLQQPGVTGRGQVTDGSGPFDCSALVSATAASDLSPDGSDVSSDDSGGTQSAPGSLAWMCLMPSDVSALEGQAGVVVASGAIAQDVIAVPITAVAGRQGSGQVTLVTSQGSQVVTVGLGRTDGTLVEITQGLSAGDTISSVAPNLTTAGPS
jgi:biotin carboxyl carrier protein